MSEREELAAGMSGERCPDGGLHTPNWQDSAWVCLDCGVALVVAELAAFADRIRADALAPVHEYRDTLARSNREYMRLHARSPKIAIATVIDRLDAAALRAAAGTPTHHTTEEDA